MASFSTTSLLSVLLRLPAFGLLWLLLTGMTDTGSWVIGAPAALIAAIVSTHLVAPVSISVFHFLRFLPVFLLRSVLAAFDVARRTLVPRLAIAPALVSYDMRLPDGMARVVFMNTVSLLPGTLSAELDGNRLSVHVLDRALDHAAELARLERTMARIFPRSDV